MAITFPRALPTDFPIIGMSFNPDPLIEVTPLRSGKIISVDLGPTIWRARWQLAEMEADQAGQLRAWYDTLLSAEAFYGYDKLREYPLQYTGGFTGLLVGSNPFTGDCELEAVAANSVEITLSALPVGFVLSVGDYLAFDYGSDDDSRALHRVVVAGTANASGNADVEVRPAIRTGWQAPSMNRTVHLYRAAAKMIVVPKSWSEQTVPPGRVSVSFEAVQTL